MHIWGSLVSSRPEPRAVTRGPSGSRLIPSLPPSEAHTRLGNHAGGSGGARPRPRPHYH